MEGRLVLKYWDHALDQWILRLNSLARWCPDLGLAPIEEENRREILQEICYGSFRTRRSRRRTSRAPSNRGFPMSSSGSWETCARAVGALQRQESQAGLYGGCRAYIALRIQELFDVKALPKIAMGRVAVVVQILAPNMRPVQVTQDLENFWVEHYPKIKSQLQRKYPKHQWR
jgi:ATP-dependent helicase HrpB